MSGRFLCGDNLEVMAGMETASVDLVFTDPPFNRGKFYGDGEHDDDMPWEEYLAWAEARVRQMVRVARRGVALYLPCRLILAYWRWLPEAEQVVIPKRAFGARAKGGKWRQQYFSVLTTAQPLGDPSNLVDGIRHPGEGYYFHEERPPHPGFTSQAVTSWAIGTLTEPGETVFDPFMGSGTTALVAERLGRSWCGCELSPVYVRLAEERLRRQREQGNLFAEGVR